MIAADIAASLPFGNASATTPLAVAGGSNSATDSTGSVQIGGGNTASSGSAATAQSGSATTAPSLTLAGTAAPTPFAGATAAPGTSGAPAASVPGSPSATRSTFGTNRTRAISGAPPRNALGTNRQLKPAGTFGQLPFTGLALWLFVLLGLTLTTLGVRLRSHAQV